MSDIRYIYTLDHPITGEVKYIGQTFNPHKRFLNHLKSQSSYGPKNYKVNWINSLRSQGLQPVMTILEECSWDTVDELETYWIYQFRAWGFKLTNLTTGGQKYKMYIYRSKKIKLNKVKYDKLGIKRGSYKLKDTIRKDCQLMLYSDEVYTGSNNIEDYCYQLDRDIIKLAQKIYGQLITNAC